MSIYSEKIIDFNGKVLTDDDISECVQTLRRFVLADNKLNRFRTDEAYLLRFLHCTDFNVTSAYSRMQDFCNLLLKHPEWFASTSPLQNKEQIDRKIKGVLRERDRSGRRIYVVKLGRGDGSKSSPSERSQIDDIWMELILDEPETQANGISIILDMSGYSWRLFRWVTPKNMRIASDKTNCYPCRIVTHVVNTSFLFNTSLAIIWPFLSNSIKQTAKFHFKNFSSLHEYISPEVLPPEYGGTGPEIDFDKLNQWLYEHDVEIGRKLRYQKISEN